MDSTSKKSSTVVSVCRNGKQLARAALRLRLLPRRRQRPRIVNRVFTQAHRADTEDTILARCPRQDRINDEGGHALDAGEKCPLIGGATRR